MSGWASGQSLGQYIFVMPIRFPDSGASGRGVKTTWLQGWSDKRHADGQKAVITWALFFISKSISCGRGLFFHAADRKPRSFRVSETWECRAAGPSLLESHGGQSVAEAHWGAEGRRTMEHGMRACPRPSSVVDRQSRDMTNVGSGR